MKQLIKPTDKKAVGEGWKTDDSYIKKSMFFVA